VPTIISHAAVPLVIGLGLGRNVVPRPLLVAGIVASMLPDLDVLAFRFGIAYSDPLGHRGFSHSLFFAMIMAAVASLFHRRLGVSRFTAFAFVLIAGASHGLLDMLTNGGLGVAYFWPLTDERFFFPERVIQVSPIGVYRFFSADGFAALESELFWIWLPASVALGVLLFLRRRNSR